MSDTSEVKNKSRFGAFFGELLHGSTNGLKIGLAVGLGAGLFFAGAGLLFAGVTLGAAAGAVISATIGTAVLGTAIGAAYGALKGVFKKPRPQGTLTVGEHGQEEGVEAPSREQEVALAPELPEQNQAPQKGAAPKPQGQQPNVEELRRLTEELNASRVEAAPQPQDRGQWQERVAQERNAPAQRQAIG